MTDGEWALMPVDPACAFWVCLFVPQTVLVCAACVCIFCLCFDPLVVCGGVQTSVTAT